MSAVSNDKPSGFFAKHEVNFYTAAAVGSLALGLLSLGVIIAAMGTSPIWYLAYHEPRELNLHWEGYNGPISISIPTEVKNASEIQNALQYGAQVGGIALAPCIVGFVLFAVAMAGRHQAMKKEQERREVESAPKGGIELNATSQKLKYIGILFGFTIGAFSAGLMIGSSTILNHGVSHVEELIKQGRIDTPNACTYELRTDTHGMHDSSYWTVSFKPSGDNFWDKLQTDWVDRTKPGMSGMIPVGLFGALGGAGLVAFSIFGRGVFSCVTCIKDRCTKDEESNEKVAEGEL